MKLRILLAIIWIIIAASSIGCSGHRGAARTVSLSAPSQAVVDVGIFYDELAPYGAWFQLESHGWVWTPRGVPFGWRPYTYGQWVWTDYGWTWVSDWRWGWAPFHYGRWLHHAHHGWVWVPGRVWGPAWVVWRRQAGYVGWAPLPPQAEWQPGVGLRLNHHDIDRLVEPHCYAFVQARQLTARHLDRHIEQAARNVTLLRDAANVTRYDSVENRVVNRGIDPDRFQRETGQVVRRHRLVDSATRRDDQIKGDDVVLFRPAIDQKASERVPRAAEPPARTEPQSDLLRHQQKEQRRLEKQQERERADLERQQRKAQKKQERQQVKPPDTPPAAELRKQHTDERRALEEQNRRERQVFENRNRATRQHQPAPQPQRQPDAKRKNKP